MERRRHISPWEKARRSQERRHIAKYFGGAALCASAFVGSFALSLGPIAHKIDALEEKASNIRIDTPISEQPDTKKIDDAIDDWHSIDLGVTALGMMCSVGTGALVIAGTQPPPRRIHYR